jgi:hypothetical protein
MIGLIIAYVLLVVISVLLGASHIKDAIIHLKDECYFRFGLDVMLACMWVITLVNLFLGV